MSTFSNPLTEYSPQMEFPSNFEEESVRSGVFNEAQEMELAARLLETTTEGQLDEALDQVIREAGTAYGSGQEFDITAVHGVLKNAARRALSLPGSDATMQNSIGARLGAGLSSSAGQVLGLELEGLSPEDRDFEAAKQFVRFAGQTARNIVDSTPAGSPREHAHRAAKSAAELYAPGLALEEQPGKTSAGRWVACRDRIILFGV